MNDDIHLLSLVELADAIAARQLSAVEVMTATVARAERLQPVLNCFISLQAERQRWRAQRQPMPSLRGARHRARCMACRSLTKICSTARATSPPAARASARTSCRTTTAPPSPALTAPARSTSAGSTWRSSPPGRPATTSTGATAATPGTRITSPAARRAAPAPQSLAAWSSARSAPTPAARWRLPSACNGVVGLKPTSGLISRHGIMPLSHTLDTVGPLTRTVRDAARLVSVIAGHDPRDPTSSSRPGARLRSRAGGGRPGTQGRRAGELLLRPRHRRGYAP